MVILLHHQFERVQRLSLGILNLRVKFLLLPSVVKRDYDSMNLEASLSRDCKLLTAVLGTPMLMYIK